MSDHSGRTLGGRAACLAASLLLGACASMAPEYQRPAGGHAVFVDAGRLLPHLPWNRYPGHALAVELYIEAGIRSCDIGSFLMDRDPVTGQEQRAPLEFTRLALPRRVYTQAHLDVIAEALGQIRDRAETVPGYRIVSEAKVLRHFTAKLDPVPAES